TILIQRRVGRAQSPKKAVRFPQERTSRSPLAHYTECQIPWTSRRIMASKADRERRLCEEIAYEVKFWQAAVETGYVRDSIVGVKWGASCEQAKELTAARLQEKTFRDAQIFAKTVRSYSCSVFKDAVVFDDIIGTIPVKGRFTFAGKDGFQAARVVFKSAFYT